MNGSGNRLVGYFGYGSLVNRATLRPGIVGAHRARLKGWRRTWRPRPDMGPTPGVNLPDGLMPALLTAERAADQAIDGLLVIDLADNLGHVDEREFRYHRRDLTLDDLEVSDLSLSELSGGGIALHVYEARSEPLPVSGPSHILCSYLDAVMQGFLNEFGTAGLHRFVAETDAFHTPIFEDRHAPVYPRAVSLSREEIEVFDAALTSRDSF
ncbi:gamma-glutamylcyclotransferase family protein [Hoeflea sp.]|uniref:gamma-glutamylcyclotransferase family protein n=1 Tax=Hoeflea sp. TaxID=1940281 RepID=UPI003747E7BA